MVPLIDWKALWPDSCSALLGENRLRLSWESNRGCIDCFLKGNEERASVFTDTAAVVDRLWRTVGIHAGIQVHGRLAFVGDAQFTCNENHAFGRTVPMLRKIVIARYSEENVCVRLRWITVEHRDLAPGGKKLGARPPLKIRIASRSCERWLRSNSRWRKGG